MKVNWSYAWRRRRWFASNVFCAYTASRVRPAADENLPTGRVVGENVSGKALAAGPFAAVRAARSHPACSCSTRELTSFRGRILA